MPVAEGAQDNTPTQSVAGTPASCKQHRKRHRQQQKPQQAKQDRQQSLLQPQHLQLKPASQKAPVRYAPCGKRDGQKLAASISQRLRKGQQVLVPAGAGMQLVRNTAMLATARSLMLSASSSTGLVFQPSFSAAAAMQPQQQQRMQQQQSVMPEADDRTSNSSDTSTSGRSTGTSTSSSSGAAKGNSKGVMLLASSIPEAQLRRFDQQPLIAARGTSAFALAGAAFARLCKQGFTSVRAAGPEATRLAMLAAAEARSKLLGCGLDLAVVPATELVDVESLAGPDGVSPYVEVDAGEGQDGFGPGEELPKQFVRVTVLHLVRCQPQQPWKLLPWAVPAEQLPSARWQQQQRQAMGEPQQQQQQQSVPAVVIASAAANQRREQQGQKQQGAAYAALELQQEEVPFPAVLQGLQPNSSSSSSANGENKSAAESSPQDAVASVAAAQRLQATVLPGDAAGSDVAGMSNALAAAAAGDLPPVYSRSSQVAANVVSAAGLLLPVEHTDGVAGWAAAVGARPCDVPLSAEQLQLLQLQQLEQQQDAAAASAGAAVSPSLGNSMVGRQPGGLLLQHKHGKKGSRQLVAAAQAGSNTPAPGRNSN
jgi:stage V sporulation protein SpoVS